MGYTSVENKQPAEQLLFPEEPMPGKRVQFDEETWQSLDLLAKDSMMTFQELADEAFRDVLKKHGRPASLKEALRRSAGESAKVVPYKVRKKSAKRKH
jgi:hypothetical protein